MQGYSFISVPLFVAVFIGLHICQADNKPEGRLKVSLEQTPDGRVREGDTVEIKCSVDAVHYNPVVMWLHNGKRISEEKKSTEREDEIFGSSAVQTVLNEYKIRISNIKQSQAGMYICQVSSEHLIKQASTEVHVLKRSNSDLLTRLMEEQRVVGPLINMWTDLRVENDLHPVVLHCRSESRTPVQTKWFMLSADEDEVELAEKSEKHRILPNGDLFFDDGISEHGGTGFRCQVVNEDGEDSQTMLLLSLNKD